MIKNGLEAIPRYFIVIKWRDCKIAWVKSGTFFSWRHFDFIEEYVLIDQRIILPECKLFEGISFIIRVFTLLVCCQCRNSQCLLSSANEIRLASLLPWIIITIMIKQNKLQRGINKVNLRKYILVVLVSQLRW